MFDFERVRADVDDERGETQRYLWRSDGREAERTVMHETRLLAPPVKVMRAAITTGVMAVYVAGCS